MEKKKSNIGYIIVIILLILGFVGYVLFDQGIIDFSNKTPDEVVEEIEELDINSRLVQNLYNSVSNEDESGWLYYWRYRNSGDEELKDFYSESASEAIKMNLVAKNLLRNYEKYASCSGLDIPKQLSEGYRSICYMNELSNSYDRQTYYDRKYVETVYKTLFGKDAKLDTSQYIRNNYYGDVIYAYVEEKDAYYAYEVATGGTSGKHTYKVFLEKAEKTDNKLHIYEDFYMGIYDSEGKNIIDEQEFKMVYTFELEDDGMYKFVSRVKKDK